MEIYTLQNKWTFYLHYKDLGSFYKDNLEKIIDIEDICTFWQAYNNIPLISHIFSDGYSLKRMKKNNAIPCGYSFFKDDISPFWEDDNNIDGFEFSYRIGKNFNNLQGHWLDILLELIGNNDSRLENLNGVRFVDTTKGNSVLYRIEFWANNNADKKIIENTIKELFNSKCKLTYRSHTDTKETI
tara:strand:+ start:685 stop:1239 length:555 start_codon:yes stop_codon:yes gene_type:complete